MSVMFSNELGVDVLQMILQQLDGEDLVNCEAVCRQWREILLDGTPWRRLFHRNKESSPLWRRAQRTLEKNKPTLRTEQYRGVCKEILRVKCNWRTGNFTKFTYPVSRGLDFALTISDDYVVWQFWSSVESDTYDGFAFLDTESMEITEIPVYCWSENVEGIIVRRDCTDTGSTVNISNPKFNWTINEEEDDFNSRQICPGGQLVICYSSSRNRGTRIEVWKMGNPPTLLRARTCEDHDLFIGKVDERFMVAVSYSRELNPEKAVTFFYSYENPRIN